ncbi:hypothetical protein JW887_04825 [Candidatus Dojkabacteria bacterium]|nr:hypothetical protein [Candidatus Dojkabacteria bacterium]
MGKTLDTTSITNELREGSAFFNAIQKKTGQKEKPKVKRSKRTSRRHDVMTSSHQKVHKQTTGDTDYRGWRKVIENTEVQNSSLRLTPDEKNNIEDLTMTLKRKYKIKTSMNELARLGLLYLLADFDKDSSESLIVKVKES